MITKSSFYNFFISLLFNNIYNRQNLIIIFLFVFIPAFLAINNKNKILMTNEAYISIIIIYNQ